ncbi:MAG: FAD:protein FMN transferase [Oscillospiraceae bacterium]|nr:FAD:protein FMN transferase [Oscillospiraceae bacterium]
MRLKIVILTVILFLGGLSGCGILNGSNETPASLSRTNFALGTFVTVSTPDTSAMAAAAFDRAFERLSEIEMIASAKNADSELFYVNQNAFKNDIAVSEELFFLLETGLYYSSLTNGAFDITLGSVVELWGIGTNAEFVRGKPDEPEISAAIENSGYEHLVLNENDRSVRFLREGLRIDLGALAKGYAADEMKRILVENGVTSAILDLGGDIHTIGNKNGAGWRIGITDPRSPGESCMVVRVFDKAVVTSGDYERFLIHEGVRYHHIFDARTGMPADSGIISATAIAESAMLADTLSTALFVMGAERAIEFMRIIEIAPTRLEIDYVLIDSDMNFYYSEGFYPELIE